MCPAAGQGALAIEIRQGDAATGDMLFFLNDANAQSETLCERSLLNALGGGCQVPIGAWAQHRGDTLTLESVVAHPGGTPLLRDSRSGNDPEKLGKDAAKALLARGADEILKAVYGHDFPAVSQP
jgi:hydroxymethylbilane synthase